MTPEELAVTRAMMDHGGSFVRALAVAYTLADPANRAKIRETWPDYWTKYADPMWQKAGPGVFEELDEGLRGLAAVRQGIRYASGPPKEEDPR